MRSKYLNRMPLLQQIPKTTSGKIRRSETGKRLAALKLTILNTATSGLNQVTKTSLLSIE